MSVTVNTDERQDLIERYQTDEIPNIFFFNPDGLVVLKLGYPDMDTPEKFIACMRRAEESARRMAEEEDALLAATEANSNDGRAFAALGDFYNRAYVYDQAAQAYRDAAALLPESDTKAIEGIRLELVFMELMHRNYDAALAAADKFEKEFPASQALDKISLYRGYGHYFKKDYEKAKTVLEELRKKYPKSVYAAKGKRILDAMRNEKSKNRQ